MTAAALISLVLATEHEWRLNGLWNIIAKCFFYCVSYGKAKCLLGLCFVRLSSGPCFSGSHTTKCEHGDDEVEIQESLSRH